MTLKGGAGYADPWVVIHADTVEQARDLIGGVEQSGLMADVGRVAGSLQAQVKLGSELGARPINAPQQQAPAQATPQPAAAPQGQPQGAWSQQGSQQYPQQPQGGYQQPQQQGGWQGGGQQRQGADPSENKHCVHGPMKFVQGGVAKRTGKPYPAFWGCTANVKGCQPVN